MFVKKLNLFVKNQYSKLLLNVTKDCVFSANDKLIKQIHDCPMGGPISVAVAFSGIYISKMEEDIVVPMKPHFYKRYLDDKFMRRKKNKPDSLFEKLSF